MSSIKKWFKSRKRNKEALKRIAWFKDPSFFCEFSDICVIKKPSNCTICLRHKIAKNLLKEMAEDDT